MTLSHEGAAPGRSSSGASSCRLATSQGAWRTTREASASAGGGAVSRRTATKIGVGRETVAVEPGGEGDAVERGQRIVPARARGRDLERAVVAGGSDGGAEGAVLRECRRALRRRQRFDRRQQAIAPAAFDEEPLL